MRFLPLLLLPVLLSAAAPVVSNIRAAQRAGTKLIDVTYDLADPDSATVFISIQIYDSSTPLPAFSLSGDVGAGVVPGFNKKITWNAGQDWNRRYTASGKARIIADDLSSAVPNATLAYIPAGFSAGSYGTHGSSSYPVFTSGFYMDKTEISKATWDSVRTWAVANGYTFDNPGEATASNHPVVGMNWYDTVKWCNARSEMEGLAPIYFTDATRTVVYRTGQVILRSTFCNFTAPGYRLPTRAEWAKAAWGGSTSGPYPWPSYYGSGAEILDPGKGNYTSVNSHPWDTSAVSIATANYSTTPCGYYNGNQQVIGVPTGVPLKDMANGFGLYDMFGNACEWLWDSSYSQVTATTEYKDDNYKGPDLGLGDTRYFANAWRTASGWDSQSTTSPQSIYNAKVYVSGSTVYSSSYYNYAQPLSLDRSTSYARVVGFRTLRGL